MGEVSFYASPLLGGVRNGFIFFKDFSLPYTAERYSFVNGIKGFCVNGSSTPTGNQLYGITMVFNIGATTDICMQQKYPGLSGLSWRRFYRPQNGEHLLFGYGRGGHGTKWGGGNADDADYFLEIKRLLLPQAE